jgi:hypothetical protein
MNEPAKGRVLITGAAGGIGSRLAEAYAKAGHPVVMTDVNRGRGEEIAARIRRETGSEEVVFIPADLAVPQQIEELFHFLDKQSLTVNILINNAGFVITKSPYELTWQEWDSVLNVNLRAAFLCAREAALRMRRAGRGGSIVNIASTRAFMSEPNTEAYAASKGGIVSLTHALAASLAPDGIRVNCVSPGWIETGDYGALREIDHRQHPAGRVGRPDDIVKACFYLTDPDNDFVTGINLTVDGGMTRKMIYEP